jgi:hypothetical protein
LEVLEKDGGRGRLSLAAVQVSLLGQVECDSGGRACCYGMVWSRRILKYFQKTPGKKCDIFKVLNKLNCLIIIFTLKTFNPEYQIYLTGFTWMYAIGKKCSVYDSFRVKQEKSLLFTSS